MSNKIQFSIFRFNPETDTKYTMQDYVVDPNECEGVMLLGALKNIKKQDPTLSFRRSCGEGVCGSDSMNINGKNGLACVTPLSSLRKDKKNIIRPLPGMNVVRDLVVDLTNFYEQYKKVKPFLKNNLPESAKEQLQSPADRAKLDGLYECILCACCSSACPSFWWNPTKFKGPAALLQAARFINDSRDTNTRERLEELEDAYSVFRCRSIMSCVDACPKGLNPTKAIGEIRNKLLDEEI